MTINHNKIKKNQQNGKISAVQQWVESVVVNLNLCPFARAAIETHGVSYKAVSGELPDVLALLGEELTILDESQKVQTSLLIIESGFSSFDDYLNLVDLAEQLLVELGYEGVYQLATFHPEYMFEGSYPEDAENYTNRSPYPIIQILRESSLDAVLESFRHPERIPEINMKLMREKGVDNARQSLADCVGSTEDWNQDQ